MRGKAAEVRMARPRCTPVVHMGSLFWNRTPVRRAVPREVPKLSASVTDAFRCSFASTPRPPPTPLLLLLSYLLLPYLLLPMLLLPSHLSLLLLSIWLLLSHLSLLLLLLLSVWLLLPHLSLLVLLESGIRLLRLLLPVIGRPLRLLIH